MTTQTGKRILVFSADPGGADCLAPVAAILRKEGIMPVVVCKGKAAPVFEKINCKMIRVDGLDFAKIGHMSSDLGIDGVLTSASSLPEKDMTEKLLWKWAKQQCLPSAAVLDQWDNYSKRFGGLPNNYPDAIFVMDSFAKKEMIEEGLPADRIIVTGHPALESFQEAAAVIKTRLSWNKTAKKQNTLIVTYFSQPIRDFFGGRLGYDEDSVLKDILSVCGAMSRRLDISIKVFCKLHPKNKSRDFQSSKIAEGQRAVFIKRNSANKEIMAQSNIVIGVNSIMMIHSILSGIPTICYQPGRKMKACDFMPVRAGVLPRIADKIGLEQTLTNIIKDDRFKEKYLYRQELRYCHKGAANNITRHLKKMLGISV